MVLKSQINMKRLVKLYSPKKMEKGISNIPLRENIRKIEALVKKNNYTDALNIITAEIKEQPKHPDLNAWFGMVLLQMDKPIEALEYLKKATELSPNVPDYHNGLGYTFFFLNKFDESIDEFNKAISLDPGHFDAHTGLCIAYTKNNNKEKAMDIYHEMKYFDKQTSKQLLTIINSNFATGY
jgi:tetratricopeptide (TPR) repeat protein